MIKKIVIWDMTRDIGIFSHSMFRGIRMLTHVNTQNGFGHGILELQQKWGDTVARKTDITMASRPMMHRMTSGCHKQYIKIYIYYIYLCIYICVCVSLISQHDRVAVQPTILLWDAMSAQSERWDPHPRHVGNLKARTMSLVCNLR